MNYFNEKNALKALELVHDFKDFALRGNIVDTAIGIIIGSALSNIVSSLVKDLLMPPLGLLMGGIHLTSFKINLHDAITNSKGVVIQKAVTLNLGAFTQTVFDFSIIAACLYIGVKIINSFNKNALVINPKQIQSKEEKLLTEIRDLLKQQVQPISDRQSSFSKPDRTTTLNP